MSGIDAVGYAVAIVVLAFGLLMVFGGIQAFMEGNKGNDDED